MSNSADMGGVGRMSAEKSSFSHTCSLLSQYLKENGSFGDLSLGMAQALDGKGKSETLRTMNLLPGMKISGFVPANNSDRNVTKSMDLFPQHAGFGPSAPAEDAQKNPHVSEQAAQMTIFYGGKVLVFDNFPANKAKELMAMASKGCPSPLPNSVCGERPNCPLPPSSTFTPTSGSNAVVAPQDRPRRPPQPIVSDLPIARKNSLHRFLEKRKDRVSSKAPYLVNGSPPSSGGTVAPVKQEETQPWLGLASQVSKLAEIQH